MRTAVRLGAYAGGLAIAFGAAFAAGGSVGALTDGPDGGAGMAAGHGGTDASSATHEGGQPGGTDAAAPPGLEVTRAGYSLVPATVTPPAGTRVPFRFAVLGPDGAPVQSYTRTHTKDVHLVVVRRDLTGYQHVHPRRSADGSWSVPLDLAAAGTYRVFADFTPAAYGEKLTLGADVSVAGAHRPVALPQPVGTATVADGYRVTLAGDAVAGEESELSFRVSRAGSDVTDLQPYLGAFGHLVSLRAGDLAFLHTHPVEDDAGTAVGGPVVRFGTTFPTPGAYRLFLDFRVGGQVRTAAFTVTVEGDLP